MKKIQSTFNGYNYILIQPDSPNGKWIWKTEFLYAFDEAEQKLLNNGYTRVYYEISNQYGSARSIRLMHQFYNYIIEKFSLEKKCCLFGFSRGGLYAFNFALFYPEYVAKIYFDAPVLDLTTWPPTGSKEQQELFREYSLCAETFISFRYNPICNIKEFASLNIPLLVVAGDSDETVPYLDNAKRLIDFYKENKKEITFYIKTKCGHHPHSLSDVEPIIKFIEKES